MNFSRGFAMDEGSAFLQRCRAAKMCSLIEDPCL